MKHISKDKIFDIDKFDSNIRTPYLMEVEVTPFFCQILSTLYG